MPNKLNSSSEITITVLGVINMYRTLASVMVHVILLLNIFSTVTAMVTFTPALGSLFF